MRKNFKLSLSDRTKKVLVITVVLLTLAVFGWYLYTHPEVIETIIRLQPLSLGALIAGYSLNIIANSYVLYFSIRYLKKSVPFINNIILTGYSAVVNFFGPLQSGPGFRALYLKQIYQIPIKQFIGVTILFYIFFAIFNATVVSVAWIITQPFNLVTILVLLAALGVLAAGFMILKRTKFWPIIQALNLRSPYVIHIAIGAVILSLSAVITSWGALIQVDPSISIWQALVYATAGNLALFVSLTPGAIGFRESFLFFSESIHHVPTTTMMTASVIDRAFNVIFLLVVFVIVLLINRRLKVLRRIDNKNDDSGTNSAE